MRYCERCRLKFPSESKVCFVCGAALGTFQDPRIGTTIAGRYQIENLLGEGGMATVYAAHHRLVDRPCAVKVMNAQLAKNAVSGITEWLFHQGIGHRYRGALIPVVAGAVIFDLAFADPAIFPTAEWGRQAAAAASTEGFPRGNSGAGAGGTAGKGPGCVRVKGGLGTASLVLPGGIVVGALVVLNSLGGLIHPLTGELYATHGGFDIPLLYHQPDQELDPTSALRNTTLGLVATNAGLTKPQVAKIADLAHDGLARGIRPAHAMRDGDTVFALATLDNPVWPPDTSEANLTDLVGHAAADAIVLAILDAARETEGVDGWPSVAEARAAMVRGG